ncbi:MAG: TIGR00341 family protein [Planctomycetota bacterium]
MELRLIQMVCPADRREEAEEVASQFEPDALWDDRLADGQILTNLLLSADEAEDALDALEEHFSAEENFHIVMLPVQAALPRPEEPEEQESPRKEEAAKGRISRQELYEDLASYAEMSAAYLAMILLAALVAAIGIWRDNVALIIGAMVIAPMLGSNMALALGNTLGDADLIWRALRTNFAGIGGALLLSVAAGALLPLAGEPQQTLWGTQAGLLDVLVALAAGGAGALAVARGTRSSLVGVMVAVALLPPVTSLGLSVGATNWGQALGAGLLFLTNLVCINLAAIVVFVLHGLWPQRFYEAAEARKATRRAVAVWAVLLAVLVAAILLAQGRMPHPASVAPRVFPG